ncbi:uncharacterized protein J7T54_003699 [Emericellopsis cladophorae]|uniref:Uncharacterized protein n=1 Tax=Emericellopsis cladophorae TaxID=2686198 RepID=A0A9Q0BBG7_9HYPO|nr:uncharacterized protein J7T54_003699 [Emericellopsis cladophorae]KAI6779777.1 hypothetical protein J7T54_003699 [Emericellopsis cladophorae]
MHNFSSTTAFNRSDRVKPTLKADRRAGKQSKKPSRPKRFFRSVHKLLGMCWGGNINNKKITREARQKAQEKEQLLLDEDSDAGEDWDEDEVLMGVDGDDRGRYRIASVDVGRARQVSGWKAGI